MCPLLPLLYFAMLPECKECKRKESFYGRENEVKYTQIKLNVGSIEEASVEPAPKVEEPKEAVDTRLDDPETIPMDIKENRSEIPLGDDVTLVSPDETIFTHVAESVNDGHAGSGYASEWHDTKSDSEDSFEVNDAYASTAHANRSFMETFGLTGTGALKTVTDKDIYSAEQETESDESEENSYEYKERLQNSEIKRMYDYAVGSIGKKLIFSIIFSVLLFFVENITLFIKEPTGILNVGEHPYLHLGASLLLLVLCSICAYEQIYHGFKSISTKDYLPESVSVIALIVVIHILWLSRTQNLQFRNRCNFDRNGFVLICQCSERGIWLQRRFRQGCQIYFGKGTRGQCRGRVRYLHHYHKRRV